MAFFEDLKRSASDVADKVVKKTTDITSIAKVNINIKASESKLNTVYEEIGYLFYTAERNGVDNTEAIAAQVLKADGIIVEIDNLKKEYARLRKMKICSVCGSEISDECFFCPICGSKLENEPEAPCCEDECDCCCEDKADEE